MTSVKGLHVIVGGNDVEQTYEVALIADAEGAAVVQLREKSRPASEVLEMADTLRKIIQHATFIINDRADIAFATGADGVHLGQDDLPIEEARKILGPGAVIGVSTSNVEQAIEAERRGIKLYRLRPHVPHALKRETFPAEIKRGITCCYRSRLNSSRCNWWNHNFEHRRDLLSGSWRHCRYQRREQSGKSHRSYSAIC